MLSKYLLCKDLWRSIAYIFFTREKPKQKKAVHNSSAWIPSFTAAKKAQVQECNRKWLWWKNKKRAYRRVANSNKRSNLKIRNFLVTLKLFLNTKCSLSLWSKLTIGHWKWFLNTNLFLIKVWLYPENQKSS